MSWLLLDTRQSGLTRGAWITSTDTKRWTIRGRTSALLRYLFNKQSRRMAELCGFAVVPGPGRFSAIRLGVLTANLLARLYHKPLISVPASILVDEQNLWDYCQGQVVNQVTYVAPIYDVAPNITQARST